MKIWKTLATSTATLVALTGLAPSQNVVYVDSEATGTANGTTWENAYTNPQNAIDAVISQPFPSDILVAEESTTRLRGHYLTEPAHVMRHSSLITSEAPSD